MLWDDLNDDVNDLNNEKDFVANDKIVWDIMKFLSLHDEDFVYVTDASTQERKKIDSSVIDLAYNYIKQQ